MKVGNQSTSNSQAKRQWSERWCSFCRAASHNTKDCRSKPKSSYFAACKVIPTSVITDKAEVGEGERNKKDTGKPRKGTECTHCQSTTHNTVDCRCKGKTRQLHNQPRGIKRGRQGNGQGDERHSGPRETTCG